ncbi:MAG: iron-sulfur cluster assembly scaffold protein [Dehalococcoidia bacterium]|nr:iron-sulfur cluster assembly scaffold protein [Dehalococcoidia bacterium]
MTQQHTGDGALDRYWAALKQTYSRIYSEVAADHMVFPRNAAEIKKHSCFGIVTDDYDEMMSIWLEISDGRIVNAAFTCDECITCTACGSIITELARNKTPEEALAITAQGVLDELQGLPEEDRHCAELAVGTLRAAINDYIGN